MPEKQAQRRSDLSEVMSDKTRQKFMSLKIGTRPVNLSEADLARIEELRLTLTSTTGTGNILRPGFSSFMNLLIICDGEMKSLEAAVRMGRRKMEKEGRTDPINLAVREYKAAEKFKTYKVEPPY